MSTNHQLYSLNEFLLLGALSLFAPHSFFSILLDFIYLFLERGREREREGEKHQRVLASHMPPTGDQTHNPGMCPDQESNQQHFGSQASTQSTEPHKPGTLEGFEQMSDMTWLGS